MAQLVAALYAKELTPAELYQICFKYKTLAECMSDLRENLEAILEKYINRTEEQLLKEQKQLSLQRCSGRPMKKSHHRMFMTQGGRGGGDAGGDYDGGGGGAGADMDLSHDENEL